MKKYFHLLLFLSIIIIVGGIIIGKISETLSNISLGLSIFGLVIFLVWFFLFLYYNKGFWSLRSTEAGANALVSGIAVVLILGMINFLAFRYQVRIDFTETKLYTLSPQSQQIVANLPQELTVYIFERQPNDLDKQLLENYQRYSPNFEFEFIDPQVNLTLTKEFKVQNTGEVHIEYGDKKKLVQTLNPNTLLSEVKLSNAITQIQREKQPVVYILQGHGEPSLEEREGSLSQGVKSLQDQGYIVKPLTLALNPVIPPDANALIIATPQKELLTGEVKTIEKFLESGGNALIMLNANVTSGLEPVLEEWGINLDERLLIDASGTGEILGLGPAITIVNNHGAHPITKDLIEGISVYPWARAISTKEKDDIEAIAILITNEQTWAESDLEAESVEFNVNNDIPGPIDLGVALTRKLSEKQIEEKKDQSANDDQNNNSLLKPRENETEEKQEDSTLPIPPEVKKPEKVAASNSQKSDFNGQTAKMVIVGNSNFATNGWFQQQLNGDVFLNAVEWLANDQAKSLSIRPKEAKNRRLNLTPLDAGIIGWLSLIIVPGLGFITAFATWWQKSR